MTSKISLTKFTQNFIKQNSWLIVLSTVATSLCTLIPLIATIISGEKNINGISYIGQNSFLPMIAIGLGFVNAIAVFKYLNSKPEVDLYHSLPITRKNIFLSRFLSGIITFVIPYILVIVITSLIALSLDSFDILVAIYFNINLIIGFFTTFAFTSLSAIITGNIFMTICLSLGLMTFPFALVSIINSLCSTHYDFYSYNTILETFTMININPLNILGYGVYNYYNSDLMIFTGLLITGLILSALSYLCFVKRPSENSSNPIAINFFKPIIKFIGVFCASALGGILFCALTNKNQNIITFLLGALIIGFITHSAFEMLYELDVRAGFKHLGQFTFTFLSVAVLVIFISFDFFGYSSRLAEIDDIKSISFSGIELTDSENIELLHNYMKSSIEFNENEPDFAQIVDYTDSIGGLSLTVNLKNGSSYNRNYGVLPFSLEDVYSIETSKDYYLKAFSYNHTLEYIKDFASESNLINVISHTDFDITPSKFLEFYEVLQSEMHLLTPKYLVSNPPVTSVYVYVGRVSMSIPVFDIQKESLEILNPTFITPNDIMLEYDTESIISDETLKLAILENMTFSANNRYFVPYMYRMNNKNYTYVYDLNYQKVGYISNDVLESLY